MNIEVTVKMPKEDLDKAVESGVEQAMKECELTIGMTLKEAVEKQIPKKPILHKDDILIFRIICPECKNNITNVWDSVWCKGIYKPKYCPICGQRLKWGD